MDLVKQAACKLTLTKDRAVDATNVQRSAAPPSPNRAVRGLSNPIRNATHTKVSPVHVGNAETQHHSQRSPTNAANLQVGRSNSNPSVVAVHSSKSQVVELRSSSSDVSVTHSDASRSDARAAQRHLHRSPRSKSPKDAHSSEKLHVVDVVPNSSPTPQCAAKRNATVGPVCPSSALPDGSERNAAMASPS